MPQPVLERPRGNAPVGERESARVTKSMRVYGEGYPGSLPGSSDDFVEGVSSHRPAALCGKDIGTRIVPLQPPQGPDLITLKRVRTVHTAFQAPDVKLSALEVNVGPSESYEFADS